MDWVFFEGIWLCNLCSTADLAVLIIVGNNFQPNHFKTEAWQFFGLLREGAVMCAEKCAAVQLRQLSFIRSARVRSTLTQN